MGQGILDGMGRFSNQFRPWCVQCAFYQIGSFAARPLPWNTTWDWGWANGVKLVERKIPTKIDFVLHNFVQKCRWTFLNSRIFLNFAILHLLQIGISAKKFISGVFIVFWMVDTTSNATFIIWLWSYHTPVLCVHFVLHLTLFLSRAWLVIWVGPYPRMGGSVSGLCERL